MRKAMIYSTALHTAVIAVAYFGVPTLFRPPPSVAPPIAVELVMELPPQKPKPKPPAHRPPRAEAPPAAPDIPPPPQIALAKPEPPPPPPKAKRKPKPKPKAKAKPKPKPVKKVAAPRPRPRPKPPAAKPKPKRKPKPDQFQALLKNLAKRKVVHAREQKQAALPVKPALPRTTPTPRRSAIETRQLEQTLGLMVLNRVMQCWSIPAGAKDAQEMQIVIRIQLNPDGSLRGAPRIIDQDRMGGNLAYRAVAESARRALLNPDCSPIKLPIEHYQIWKDIVLNFEPGKALGQ
ncbi:MAG: cell envelope integrity protein TolA [Alphaproteobacteria bacterium]